MGAPFKFTRSVRWDELDAAGFVYFPRVVALAHEAMERMFEAASPRGYSTMVSSGLGLPCVHVETDFRAPLRFGDVAEVEAVVKKLGRSSVELEVNVRREGVDCARIGYVVACTELRTPKAVPLPASARAMFLQYVASPS
jgi:4-hydroxybenzoyl-CoA thioesterase